MKNVDPKVTVDGDARAGIPALRISASAAVCVAIVVTVSLLAACGFPVQVGADMPKPSQNVAYVRSIHDPGEWWLHAVDVEKDEVVGRPIEVGADTSVGYSMAMAPSGKIYLVRGTLGSPPFRPNADRGLLILDPNRGWQRIEPPMPDELKTVGVSADGKAFLAWASTKDRRTFKLDVLDPDQNRVIHSTTTDFVISILTTADGLVYLNQNTTRVVNDDYDVDTSKVQVIRSSDFETVADIRLNEGVLTNIAFGPDGLLYGVAVNRLPASQPRVPRQKTGLLVAMDTSKAQVVARLPLPHARPYGLAITQEGKAYIFNRESQASIPCKVTVYNLQQRRVLKEIPIGPNAIFIKQVAPTKVYAGNLGYHDPGRIWVIDTATDTVVKTFEVGTRPESIVMTPFR